MASTSSLLPPTRPDFDFGKSAFLVLLQISGLSVLFVVLSALSINQVRNRNRIQSRIPFTHDLSVLSVVVSSLLDLFRIRSGHITVQLLIGLTVHLSRFVLGHSSHHSPRISLGTLSRTTPLLLLTVLLHRPSLSPTQHIASSVPSFSSTIRSQSAPNPPDFTPDGSAN